MIYKDTFYSLVKFVQDFRQEVSGIASLTYVDWEEHSDLAELPDGDLIGLTGFTLGVDDGMHSSVCAIGVSTVGDPNLFRHREIMARLYDKLGPAARLVLYDHANAIPMGWMVLKNGTQVHPMTRADVRPLQFIQFELEVDPTSA